MTIILIVSEFQIIDLLFSIKKQISIDNQFEIRVNLNDIKEIH